MAPGNSPARHSPAHSPAPTALLPPAATLLCPAATLLRGEIIFPDGAGKTNFPVSHFLRHLTLAAGEPRSSGRGGLGSALDFEREM